MKSTGLYELGQLVRQRRIDADYTLDELGKKLRQYHPDVASSAGHLSQVENGRSWPSEQLVDCLDQIFGRGTEFRSLLRTAKVPATARASVFELTAHLFKPVYLGASFDQPDLPPIESDMIHLGGVQSFEIDPTTDLHVFPFDVAVAHERHELEFRQIAELATWRAKTIGDELEANQTIGYFTGISEPDRLSAQTAYVLSAFVLNSSVWDPGSQQATAVRMLTCPSVVLKTQASDQEFIGEVGFDQDDIAFEESLLVSDYPIIEGSDFGVEPLSYGYASWAGVAYHPTNPRRALPPDYLANFEIQLQAVWCFANAVASGLTNLHYDEVFNIRSLTRALNRIGTREDHQYRRMRDAIIETSRINDVANDAIDFLTTRQVG
jgi:transcriptional regulator with XRE-family HTH domain